MVNLNAARVALRRVREANIIQKNLKKKVNEAHNTYMRKLKYGSLPHNAELYKSYYNTALKHQRAYNNYVHLSHNFLNMLKNRSPRTRYPNTISKSNEKKIENYAKSLTRQNYLRHVANYETGTRKRPRFY